MADASGFVFNSPPTIRDFPNVNFDWLGNLTQQYQQGQQYGLLRQQQTAFQNGMPQNPDGSINWNAALQKYMQLGGTPAVAGMAPQALKMDWANQVLGGDTGVGGGVDSTGAPGGAQPAPQSAQGSPPPFMPQTARPSSPANGAGPQNIGGQYNRPGNIVGGQILGSGEPGQSLRQIVGANGGSDTQAGQIAARLGINADDPVSQQDAPRIGRLLLTMGLGQSYGRGRAPDSATNQYAGPVSTGEVSANAGETNSSQGTNAIGPAAAAPSPYVQGTGGGGPAPAGRDSVPQPNPAPAVAGSRQVAQGQYPGVPAATAPGNPDANIATIRNLEKAQEFYYKRGQALSVVDPAAGKPDLDRAQALGDRAKAAREALQSTATEQNKLNIKHYQDFENAVIGQGLTGQGMSENAQNARPILQHPDFYSGVGAEFGAKTSQFAQMFGLGSGNQATLLGAFNKITSKSILDQMSTLKQDAAEGGVGSAGRVFAAQVEQMIKASPSQDNTVDANLYLATVQERAGERMQQIANAASQYKIQHGGLDAQFEQGLIGWLKAHPLMSDAERANPLLATKREFKSPDEALAAKVAPGETIRVRTGPDPMNFRYMTLGGKQKPTGQMING